MLNTVKAAQKKPLGVTVVFSDLYDCNGWFFLFEPTGNG